MLLIWKYDRKSPFYVAKRIGKNHRPFAMIKLRSMVSNADKSGLFSTSSSDQRITPVGQIVRRYKLDELMQLWNVLKGEMSLVGPRPNVAPEVDLYTDEERKLLNTRPGMTDFASIVFSDEGDILDGSSDPDLKYNQVIRPWKNRLGLLYVEKRSTILDLQLISLTILALVSKQRALLFVSNILMKLNADPLLISISKRDKTLIAYPPPGANTIVGQDVQVNNNKAHSV